MIFYIALKYNKELIFKRYLIILFVCSSLQSQDFKEWTAPLDIPVRLSGTFGEIRSNHFHAGLDIRTQGRQGLKVKSVQSGWVNRIRVSTSGYGKAIYIQHLDGTLSVYAHLKKFAPKIEDYVKAKQYQKESFTIQLFPKADELKIELGELIGYSGNTGGSMGPHLHFEMRNSQNQNPFNPMKYPFEIEDTQRPQIQNFYLYSGTNNLDSKKEYPLVRKNDSVYVTSSILTAGKLHVGLRLFDRQNHSYNKNGIYGASVRLNGIEKFKYKMDELSFKDSKNINLFIDYKTFKEKRRRIQRLLAHPKQNMSFLAVNENDGQFIVEAGKSYQLLVEVLDYNGNSSYVEAYITGNEKSITPTENSKNFLESHLDYLYDFKDASVYFPKNTFFEKVELKVKHSNDTLYVGQDIYPLNKPFELNLKIPQLDSGETGHYFLAKINNGKASFLSSNQEDGRFIYQSKSLGVFAISKDSIAPKIKAVNFKNNQWLSKYNYLRLKIQDDYTGVKSFRGEINGRWIRLEYEPKDHSLVYDFNDLVFDEALHQLSIEAEDFVGNKTHFTINFYRKPIGR